MNDGIGANTNRKRKGVLSAGRQKVWTMSGPWAYRAGGMFTLDELEKCLQ